MAVSLVSQYEIEGDSQSGHYVDIIKLLSSQLFSLGVGGALICVSRLDKYSSRIKGA